MSQIAEVRCGVGGHGQIIGRIRGMEDGVLFTRLPRPEPTEYPGYGEPGYEQRYEAAEQYKDEVLSKYPNDPPWSGRVVGAGRSRDAERAFAQSLDATEILDATAPIGTPLTGWAWLTESKAADRGLASTGRALMMEWEAFHDGGPDDGLEYWCPRHPALSLPAHEAQKAIRLGKPAIAVQLGR